MSFIDAHTFSVDLVLQVLGIPPSTYYDWRARQVSPSCRQMEDTRLLEMIVKIRTVHEFAGTYGSPRVWLELRRQGVRVGRKRVERIMREHGLAGAHLRRGWKHGSTRQNPAHTRTGSGGPRLPGDRAEPAVGGRSDPAGHRRGCAV